MMRDFWETHHWPEGQRRAHWHLLFDDQPAVHDYARAHAELLDRHPELSPVPVEWLHATLQSIGPLSPDVAAAVADAAIPALASVEPFEFEIGPAQAIHNGVVPAIYPEEGISALFWALRQATESIVGTEAMPTAPDRFWPHLSLAYSNARWDHDDLSRALAKLRPPRPTVRVTRAVLVDQEQAWRDTYTWRVIAEVPLGIRPAGDPAGVTTVDGGGRG
ncbi:2'-5' RNA ligase family protein [Streptomyces sp. NPDC090493]|uniref:2'-5' RNA ligase family protein n=1 Tax=Streptomyces sp. NPDC090493 TaxID=3365964 RepID=UPI003800E180